MHNIPVFSALAIAGQIPELYELIYRKFPEAYNKNGGLYGRITAVSKMNPANSKTPHKTRFTDQGAKYASPEGFIIPLVYGLSALLERREDGTIAWKTDPTTFLNDNLDEIAKRFKGIMQMGDFDPQKVGKSGPAYTMVRDTYTTLAGGEGRGGRLMGDDVEFNVGLVAIVMRPEDVDFRGISVSAGRGGTEQEGRLREAVIESSDGLRMTIGCTVWGDGSADVQPSTSSLAPTPIAGSRRPAA
ncbi:hypothetical protein [Microbacterium elymi]|uniref:Uncharacterized protein n=1 Tax=Microbacterium elymi TaxID=2909587 RepID=A0ABY5NMJ3_9MICO|nr:hypothetical protein [Microbacterium elymi]UUT36403.1 hypothetical protein L2X98_26115 [Microbacterium elymi]